MHNSIHIYTHYTLHVWLLIDDSWLRSRLTPKILLAGTRDSFLSKQTHNMRITQQPKHRRYSYAFGRRLDSHDKAMLGFKSPVMRAFMESVEDGLRIPSSSFQIHGIIFSANSYRLQVFGITEQPGFQSRPFVCLELRLTSLFVVDGAAARCK